MMFTVSPPPPATANERLARAFAAVEADMAALWVKFNDTHATPEQLQRMLAALSDKQLQVKLQAHLDEMEPVQP